MNDVEFTRALERGEIANENFRHTAHLHVAWVYLSESSSVEGAAAKMRATLRKFAASAGKPEKYHETITLFGFACSRTPGPSHRRKAWKTSWKRIRSYWKRISHSLTIRVSDFSVRMHGLNGWNPI